MGKKKETSGMEQRLKAMRIARRSPPDTVPFMCFVSGKKYYLKLPLIFKNEYPWILEAIQENHDLKNAFEALPGTVCTILRTNSRRVHYRNGISLPELKRRLEKAKKETGRAIAIFPLVRIKKKK